MAVKSATARNIVKTRRACGCIGIYGIDGRDVTFEIVNRHGVTLPIIYDSELGSIAQHAAKIGQRYAVVSSIDAVPLIAIQDITVDRCLGYGNKVATEILVGSDGCCHGLTRLAKAHLGQCGPEYIGHTGYCLVDGSKTHRLEIGSDSGYLVERGLAVGGEGIRQTYGAPLLTLDKCTLVERNETQTEIGGTPPAFAVVTGIGGIGIGHPLTIGGTGFRTLETDGNSGTVGNIHG